MGVELQTIRPAGSRYTDRLQCLIGFYYSSTGDYAEFPHSTKWLAQRPFFLLPRNVGPEHRVGGYILRKTFLGVFTKNN